jgi:hypothetical protein
MPYLGEKTRIYLISVSCYTRDSPLLVSSAAEAYKPSAELHFLYFRHLNLYQLYPHILKPNYMPNTVLYMQLSIRQYVISQSFSD